MPDHVPPATRRVVLLTSNFGAAGSGAERQMERVLAHLAGRGWSVHVVARRTAEGPPDAGPIPVSRVGRAGTGPWRAVLFTVDAARTTARLQPDVTVSLQLGSNPAAAVLASLFGRRRIPAVGRLTGLTPAGSQLEARSAPAPVRWATGAVLRRLSALVSPAQHLLDRPGAFAQALEGKGVVIPNGAPDEVPDRASPPGRSVMWIGRDDSLKQFDHLVELARRIPDVPFQVVGLGNAAVPDNVQLLGRKTAEAVLEALAGAALLVGTSKAEGVPNTMLEALAVGVPVVAYDIPGTREAATGMAGGVTLVPLGDLDALESAVRGALAGGGAVEGRVPTIAEVGDDWEQVLGRVIEGRPIVS